MRVLFLCTGNSCRSQLAETLPVQATGSDEEVMAVFRAVRDDIARRIAEVLAWE